MATLPTFAASFFRVGIARLTRTCLHAVFRRASERRLLALQRGCVLRSLGQKTADIRAMTAGFRLFRVANNTITLLESVKLLHAGPSVVAE